MENFGPLVIEFMGGGTKHTIRYYQFTICNTVFIWRKRSESYERQNRPIQSNSAITDATRPIQRQLGRYDSANNDDVTCFFSYQYKHGGVF